MFHRSLNPSNQSSFFLFGARGTGKSTYLRTQWGNSHHYINLLLGQHEDRYLKNPDLLVSDVMALKTQPLWVVIDEIQKVPKLLDIVHELIETQKIKFVLTGSSARKLKRQASNLLAGRAFRYELFPLTHQELGKDFSLDFVLNWGALPSIFSLESVDRSEYLKAYCQTYLREEILQEQIVRSGVAFRSFLEVAAQQSGKSLNFSKVARDVGVDTKTAQSFFQILEDTLLGALVPAFHRSRHKSVALRPKFYLFDLGIKKAIEGSLESPLVKQSSAYGEAFEHFFFLELRAANSYQRKDFSISHYQTNSGGEIDFVLHKSKKVIAVEVKSASKIDLSEVKKLSSVAAAIKPDKIFYVSNDTVRSKVGDVHCLPWREFFAEFPKL